MFEFLHGPAFQLKHPLFCSPPSAPPAPFAEPGYRRDSASLIISRSLGSNDASAVSRRAHMSASSSSSTINSSWDGPSWGIISTQGRSCHGHGRIQRSVLSGKMCIHGLHLFPFHPHLLRHSVDHHFPFIDPFGRQLPLQGPELEEELSMGPGGPDLDHSHGAHQEFVECRNESRTPHRTSNRYPRSGSYA